MIETVLGNGEQNLTFRVPHFTNCKLDLILTDTVWQLGGTPDLGRRAIGVLVVRLPLEVHAVRALILDRLDVVPELPAGGSGWRIVSARKH